MPKAQIYVHLPIGHLNESVKDPKNLFTGLGKATRRGIKRCYKCGEYNGTRGFVCKNKQCNATFKDYGDKYKANLDSVKLVSGHSRQVYSVRVRDRGPNCRGFVQLPLESDNTNKLSEVALCFVDTCQRQFNVSILKCHESEQTNASSICVHIESALRSCNVATPVQFNMEVLKTMHIPQDVKEKLWQITNESKGVIVQRVSRTVMAIKCQVTPKHPLGYLHFTLCSSSKGKETYDKYYCSCNEFTRQPIESSYTRKKCIHYYACICAFASNTKLVEEFSHFINSELNIVQSFNSQKELSCSKTLDLKAMKVSKKRKSFKTNRSNDNIHISTSWEFIDWLTSVTENLNKILIQKSDQFKSVTYSIPENFFILFKQRVNSNGIKIQISENYFKYTWYIKDQNLLGRIFNTDSVCLQWPNYKILQQSDSRRKTFKEPVLAIEWIPKVFDVSKTGQLILTVSNL